MNLLLPILAQSDDGIGKILFPIIFFIIWALSALAGTLGKRQKEKERRRRLEQQTILERMEAERRERGAQAPPAPPPVVRPPERRRTLPRDNRGFGGPAPVPPPTPVPPRPQKQPRPAKQPRPQRADPSQAVPSVESPILTGATRPIRATPAPSRTRGSAAEKIRQLMSPATLRQQIALMEILNKPVALRDRDGV